MSSISFSLPGQPGDAFQYCPWTKLQAHLFKPLDLGQKDQQKLVSVVSSHHWYLVTEQLELMKSDVHFAMLNLRTAQVVNSFICLII